MISSTELPDLNALSNARSSVTDLTGTPSAGTVLPLGIQTLTATFTPADSLRKNGHRVDCELRFHGESYGWECQCLCDGELAYGRRFVLRAPVREEAEAQRTRLLAEGWS